MYVADRGNHQIQKLRQFLQMFGQHGSCTLGQFINPESVIVSQRGWLIVSDGQ